jgi:hypothetical protein
MIRLNVLIIFFVNALICFGQKSKTDTLTILAYGYPSEDYSKYYTQYNTIGHKYHFKYSWIGTCNVSKNLIDSANKHNRFVDSLLDRINSKNWRENISMK